MCVAFVVYVIVALIYYVVNIRATTKLGDPVFFDKDAWISLVRQVGLIILSLYASTGHFIIITPTILNCIHVSMYINI